MDTRSLAGDETDSSDDEALPGGTPSTTQELERTASERHAFLFGHNLSTSASDIRDLHPLPSHVPFLLDVFSENVNFIIQIVHMPTVIKMARDLRGSGMASLTPSNEALLFSMYYAAVTSMEEEDVSHLRTLKPMTWANINGIVLTNLPYNRLLPTLAQPKLSLVKDIVSA